MLLLPCEKAACHIGRCVARAGHCRDFSSAAAHHALSAALGGPLGALLAPTLCVAAVPPAAGSLYSQFSRESCHPTSRQSFVNHGDVGCDAVVYIRGGQRAVVGSGGAPGCCRGGDLAHLVVRHTQKIEDLAICFQLEACAASRIKSLKKSTNLFFMTDPKNRAGLSGPARVVLSVYWGSPSEARSDFESSSMSEIFTS